MTDTAGLPLPKPTTAKDKARHKRQEAQAMSEAAKEALSCDGRCMAYCCPCKLDPLARKLDAHHIIPRSQGGPDTPDNLITLCQKYGHAAAHHGYHDGRKHIPGAEFMRETLGVLRGTNLWRWSEEAWEYTVNRSERVRAKVGVCPECRRSGTTAGMKDNGPNQPETCERCGYGND